MQKKSKELVSYTENSKEHQGRKTTTMLVALAKSIFWPRMKYLLFLILFPSAGYGVTQYKSLTIPFTREPSELNISLAIPVKDNIEKLSVPSKKIRFRVRKNIKDKRVEQIKLSVGRSKKSIREMANEIAKPKYQDQLYTVLSEKVSKAKKTNFTNIKVQITKDDLKLIQTSALGRVLEKPHHRVQVVGKKISENQIRRLLNQIRDHIPFKQRKRIRNRLKRKKDVSVDKFLLPPFAKKVIKKFLVFKGPNCFHAALAFHNVNITKSPLINVKKEKGYHRAMINYDELWRAINMNFYEVPPKQSDLQYGDMLVFFDMPQDEATNFVNFRWIRHTATYLFGSYTFSKGSKSPNTPYTVKTLDEEWRTWRSYTKNLGVKVFRRARKSLGARPPEDRLDWLY